MSQHIHGEIGQSVRNDYGDFITVGCQRIRKSLIISYKTVAINDDLEGRQFGVLIVIPQTNIGIAIGTKEDAEKEVLRLDWIFKGEGK